jgi:single-stranded-DNA-specific exonuclease
MFMNKIWNILPAMDRSFIESLSEYTTLDLQLLYNRNIRKKKDIEDFFSNDYDTFAHSPFKFKDMEKVIELIIRHIKEKNKIFVYGDYDADGITASAVLYETLATLKADVGVYIPYRITEGYGLNENAIDEISKSDGKLLITVDTGIRNKNYVKYAQEKGIDVVVTDHHPPPPASADLPECLIINPMAQDEQYPYKYLAGVGVAFKLVSALISKTKLDEEHKLKLEERVMDMVAIGTVADLVKLTGENRLIVKKGLKLLNKTKRTGLKELIRISQLSSDKALDSWNIGFQIAPRLNAAGRLEHANTAFELLITKDKEEARSLSSSLNENNLLRQSITESVVKEIEELIKDDVGKKKIIVAVSPRLGSGNQWNEGVIGLAAGKLSERYYLPAIVITSGDNIIKGSGRSIPEYSLIKALEECSDLLSKYGGHPAACGLALDKENLDKFVNKIEDIAERDLKNIKLKPKILIDTELELGEVSVDLCEKIEKFAPFGNSNERPVFVSRNLLIVDVITMGNDKQHIKFRIKSDTSPIKTALAFGKAGSMGHFEVGDKIDLVYYVDLNGFNGRKEAQLKIVDIRSHNA